MPDKETGGYPDFNSPLNTPKAPKDPRAPVVHVIPGTHGTGAPDPLGYLPAGKKKGKK